GRCRVVGGVVETPPPRLALEEILVRTELDLPHAGRRGWTDAPGSFAAGHLDEGTGALLRTLTPFAPGTRVLDYGAGTGVIGAVAAALGAEVTLLEADALAAAAARCNLPEARVVEGYGWSALDPDATFERVLANPPWHIGKAETVAPVLEFLAGVPRHLAPEGSVRFVVQRRLPVEATLRDSFARVEVVADRGPFRVWQAGGA
ncbi:MAG: methyltransferase, partial [Longimicrobiales bacterium]|nr:methyltransferase [Longimicrobiales bacterium]